MNFQGALQTLVGSFIAFYMGCVSIGRPDIPMKLVTELRVKAIQGAAESWGCPSAFSKEACTSYDPRRYR